MVPQRVVLIMFNIEQATLYLLAICVSSFMNGFPHIFAVFFSVNRLSFSF